MRELKANARILGFKAGERFQSDDPFYNPFIKSRLLSVVGGAAEPAPVEPVVDVVEAPQEPSEPLVVEPVADDAPEADEAPEAPVTVSRGKGRNRNSG